MTRGLPLSIVIALFACDAPAPSSHSPAPPTEHSTAIASLPGVWAGRATRSPLGAFPVALASERAGDGSVHARMEFKGGAYLDLRFHRQGDAWLLTEEGYLPSLGTQSHTLVPVPGGPGARWVDRRDPATLAVDLDADQRTMILAARLRGKEHARLELERVEGKAADEARARIANGQPLPAGTALSSPR